jgi:hypothetical protein
LYLAYNYRTRPISLVDSHDLSAIYRHGLLVWHAIH